MSDTSDEYRFYAEPEDTDMSSYSQAKLIELASTGHGDYRALALTELADRAPMVAMPLAREALSSKNQFLVATGLAIVASADLDAAIEVMTKMAPDWSSTVLQAIVEIIAVDHSIAPTRAAGLLTALAERLAVPGSSAEFDAAELFFRRYPTA
jgi:hypothetical protein